MAEPRKYSSPQAFRAALNRRIKNRADEEGRPQRRLLQVVVFERFMVRLQQIVGDHMMLKGGLLLELRLSRARTTKDIDLCLEHRREDLLSRLQEAGRLDLGDHLHYEVRLDPRHPVLDAEGMKYQGERYRVVASIAGKRIADPFGLDVAYAEPIVDRSETVVGGNLLEFIGVGPGVYRAYPVESHLSEKVHAYTLPRERLNSRVKDLPDIALLGTVGELDAVALQEAIRLTFGHRATHRPPERLPEPPAEWSPVYAELALQESLEWPSLEDVRQAASEFVDPILAGIDGVWDPKQWGWKRHG